MLRTFDQFKSIFEKPTHHDIRRALSTTLRQSNYTGQRMLLMIHYPLHKLTSQLILDDLSDSPEDAIKMPDWAFLIKHGDRVVLWDTGLAVDLSIYPPATQKRMPTFKRTKDNHINDDDYDDDDDAYGCETEKTD